MNGFMMCVLLAATGQVGDRPERDYGWQINPDDGKLEYIVQLSPDEANFMVSAVKEHASDVPAAVAARLSRVVVRIGTVPLISTPMEEVLKIPPVTTAVLANNVEATAGPGRYSELERGPSVEVMNVAGDKSPPSLSGGSGTPLPATPSTLLADQANQLGNKLGDTISSRAADSLRKAENLLAQNLAPNTAANQFLGESRGASTGTGKFSSTGTQPASPPAGSTSAPLPGAPSGLGNPSTPGSNYPTSPTHNHAPGDGYHNDGTIAAPPTNSTIGSPPSGGNYGSPAYPASSGPMAGANSGANSGQLYNSPNNGYAGGAAPGYNPSTGYGNPAPNYTGTGPNFSSGANSGMAPIPGGNFGGMPRGAANQPVYNQYATPGSAAGAQYPYAQPNYAYPQNSTSSQPNFTPPFLPDPLALPRPDSQPTLVADSRTPASVPSTSRGSNTTGRGESAGTNKLGKDSESAPARDVDLADAYPNGRSGMENILPVMFVLSLVVNFYLGMLIRKLLARYRSLLSSVRSQAV